MPYQIKPARIVGRRRSQSRVDITIPGGPVGVQRAPSFYDHVPSIARLAQMTTRPLSRGRPNNRYVHTTVVVDRGTIRVKDVVLWDTTYGFGMNAGGTPSVPAEIKFMGVDVMGHAANECVIEVPDSNTATIAATRNNRAIAGTYAATRKRNQLAPENTVEILVRNYEYQRASPVPWGMDFQWLFARLGYRPVSLRRELGALANSTRGHPTLGILLQNDLRSLVRGGMGFPFPYIVSNGSLIQLSALTDINHRPLCVPGQ